MRGHFIMSRGKILFIVEGKRTEPKVLKEICLALNFDEEQIYSYQTNIFSLYHKLKKIEPTLENINIIRFIKDIENDKENSEYSWLNNLNPRQVSEIYLLFDLDAHHSANNDQSVENAEGNLKIIEEMLKKFMV